MVLLKHVLPAIPMFHLMALTLNKGSAANLEQLCRQFLWDPRERGHPKVPLVACATISQPTAEHGLGIFSYLKHSQLLKLCCASQLIESQPTAWVRMAEDLIRMELRRGLLKRERRKWTPFEALLLRVSVHTRSKTTNSILGSL